MEGIPSAKRLPLRKEGVGGLESLQPKARRLVLIGDLLSLAGGEGRCNDLRCDVSMEGNAAVASPLGTAQLRAIVNTLVYNICTQTTIITEITHDM
jgi:hypothetical protein